MAEQIKALDINGKNGTIDYKQNRVALPLRAERIANRKRVKNEKQAEKKHKQGNI